MPIRTFGSGCVHDPTQSGPVHGAHLKPRRQAPVVGISEGMRWNVRGFSGARVFYAISNREQVRLALFQGTREQTDQDGHGGRMAV